MPMNLLSIIIVNYNGVEFVDDCVQSILRSTYPDFEIIVVDNNSTDQSARVLDKYRKDLRFKPVYLSENLYYAAGNNIGISRSKGEYLLFLNMDTILEPDCLKELAQEFESDESISAVQCLLAKMKENGIDSAGGTIDFCCRLLPVSLLWARNDEARKERRLFWGCGAGLAIRREVLNRVGWFDTEIPTDEVDLCWRINLAGGKIVLSPGSVVRHFGSGSFGRGLTKERLYFGELARLFSILKNYELGNLVRLTPYMTAYFMITVGWDAFFRRRIDILLFRLKAYAYVVKNLRQILVKRSVVQKYVRKLSDAEVMKLTVRPNPYYYLIT
jgi:hypothetical protein